MSDHLDQALAAIDVGLQRPTLTQAMEADTIGDPDRCWKCELRTTDGRAGLCAPCRAQLVDETYTAPAPNRSLIEELLFRDPGPIVVDLRPAIEALRDIIDAFSRSAELLAGVGIDFATFFDIDPTRRPRSTPPAKPAHRRRYHHRRR